jgi:MFS superfamily sulfate permease-like transporter
VSPIKEKDFRFTLEETAGALGDYGTLLPIVIAVSLVTEMDLARMLFFFGLAYLGTGLYYKLPMPVEPMKAIGVIAIAEGLSGAEIAGAGLGMGMVLLVIALTGSMDLIKRVVPVPLIRGIQVGLGLTLMQQALRMMGQDLWLGIVSFVIILAFTFLTRLDISALVVFLLGIGAGIYRFGLPPLSLMTLPAFTLPGFPDVFKGFLAATLPQIPLTLGNAVLATSLLITDLLDRKVKEKQLLFSMSAMCLFSIPFGGFPMCHGAGGLAAQYRFGARTGGSNIISGVLLLLVALFFATPQLELVIPFGALGALLIYSGFALLRTAQKTDDKAFALATGVLALLLGMMWAFLIMGCFYFIRARLSGPRPLSS